MKLRSDGSKPLPISGDSFVTAPKVSNKLMKACTEGDDSSSPRNSQAADIAAAISAPPLMILPTTPEAGLVRKDLIDSNIPLPSSSRSETMMSLNLSKKIPVLLYE